MGCAGLSLAVHLARSPWAEGRRILMVDRDRKDRNDRTWCFWETAPGPFEEIVHRRWEKAWFHASGYSGLKDLAPYAYKMVRGIDYYRHCMEILSAHPSFEIHHGEVEALTPGSGHASVRVDGIEYEADQVFNSILFEPPVIAPHEIQLLQHFKGWVIETEEDRFDTREATLMDFRPPQDHGTTFVYVMPLSPRRALVEYTLFTPDLLDSAAYDKGLSDYIGTHMGLTEYRVAEEEFGVIPMTNHRFPSREGRVMHIGTPADRRRPPRAIPSASYRSSRPASSPRCRQRVIPSTRAASGRAATTGTTAYCCISCTTASSKAGSCSANSSATTRPVGSSSSSTTRRRCPKRCAC